jgi:hypothetical protein
MTLRDVVGAVLRRWYVPIIVLMCTALVTAAFARDGGSYSSRTIVSFLLPPATSLAPDNGTNDSSVVAFAGAIVNAINNGRPPAPYSLSDAPYYGAGVREGIRVDLADSGNQWVSTFNRSDVEIRIVGRSQEWVQAQQDRMIDLVLSFADAEQSALLIPAEDQIRASVAPLTTEIEHVSASQSIRITAVGAMAAVAVIVSVWASIALDRLIRRLNTTTVTRQRASPRRILEGTPS